MDLFYKLLGIDIPTGAATHSLQLKFRGPLPLWLIIILAVILVAGVLLWAGAEAVGVVGNIENFMVDIGFEDFTFVPGKLLSGVALGGLVIVVAGTCANVLLAALFNLMSDVVGGLRLTLQEDVGPAPKDEGTATV